MKTYTLYILSPTLTSLKYEFEATNFTTNEGVYKFYKYTNYNEFVCSFPLQSTIIEKVKEIEVSASTLEEKISIL